MTAIAEIPAPAPSSVRLPTEDDLPYSDGIPIESNWHVLQVDLLRHSLELHWSDHRRFFAGGNMFLYFNAERLLNRDFRGPDFFVALDVEDRARKSWVVWQENKGPDVIIELLSESTAEIDRTIKKRVYQDEVRVPEYYWYDPDSGELAGFALREGVYEPIVPDESGLLASRRLGLKLVRWRGTYGRMEAEWLRWATPEGVVLPSPQEVADEEHNRADRLAARLRALGVDPDE